MTPKRYKIFPLGDAALTVEFGNVISEPLNRLAISVANFITQLGIPGIIETVPAYASATVYYDPIAIRRSHREAKSAFEAVASIVRSAIETGDQTPDGVSEPIEIQVDFSEAVGLDLPLVAEVNQISIEEVITLFTSQIYRVYMIGFLPGFAYMGEIDQRIATPRKEVPRVIVPAGSIGIAGRQTGIYSLPSPGGWQIIGRTDVQLFRLDRREPCLLKPGDCVRFVPVK